MSHRLFRAFPFAFSSGPRLIGRVQEFDSYSQRQRIINVFPPS